MESDLHPKITVQFYTEVKCFGPGVATLLRLVRELHSLSAAAMSISMAYSKAWTIVKNAERELGFPLLHSTKGGRSGGGAVLTPEGERLLADYEAYAAALKAAGARMFAERFAWLENAKKKGE